MTHDNLNFHRLMIHAPSAIERYALLPAVWNANATLIALASR